MISVTDQRDQGAGVVVQADADTDTGIGTGVQVQVGIGIISKLTIKDIIPVAAVVVAGNIAKMLIDDVNLGEIRMMTGAKTGWHQLIWSGAREDGNRQYNRLGVGLATTLTNRTIRKTRKTEVGSGRRTKSLQRAVTSPSKLFKRKNETSKYFL